MTRAEVRTRIEEVGILPAIRVSSSADALFSAEAVFRAGIPVAEITMTTPGAIEKSSAHSSACFSPESQPDVARYST